MHPFSTLSAALLFAATALAATVTEPSLGTLWDASKSGQTVAWTYVATDPSNFTISLANTQSNVNVILKQHVLTASNSTTVDGPPTGWPTGNGFQINLVQTGGSAIYTQSQPFNITGATKPFSSSSSTGTAPGSTGTGSSGNGSSGNAMSFTVQAGFMAGLVLVGAFLT